MRRSEINYEVEELVEHVEAESSFKKPKGVERKLYMFDKEGYTEDEIKIETAAIEKDFNDDGYVRIKSLRDITKIYGQQLTAKIIKKIKTGRVFCFVWEYSGFLDLIVRPDDKVKYIDGIKKRDQYEIMALVKEERLADGLYFVDEHNFPQKVRDNGRMHARKKNGDFIYFKSDSGASYPKVRDIMIDDLPLALIKEIVKRKGFKPAQKKAGK